MPIKIAIVDDHMLIAEGVKNMLRYAEHIEVVAMFTDGDELLNTIPMLQPDVVLLDIYMPGKQGDALAAILRKDHPDIRILVLTNLDNIVYIKSMLQHNVNGYLLKDINRAGLITAIELAYEHKHYFDNRIYERMEEDEKDKKRMEQNASLLSRREIEVLKLFAEGYTINEVAEQLCISRRTVEHHRENLMEKLEVKGTLNLVKKAGELGLIANEL